MSGFNVTPSVTIDVTDYEVVTHFIQLSVTHPVAPKPSITVVGTGNKYLNPLTYNFIDIQSIFTLSGQYGDSMELQGDGRVKILRDCQIKAGGYVDLTHSANGSTVGLTFVIDRGGFLIVSPRAIHGRVPNNDDIQNIAGYGRADLLAGDFINLIVASDTSGDVTPESGSMFFETLLLEKKV